MRMPGFRQSLIVTSCGGAVVLLAIVAAALTGALTAPEAAILALVTGCLGAIAVVAVWLRRLDGKVQRLDAKVRRLIQPPDPAPQRRLEERLDHVQAAVDRLGDVAGRLEERTATVLATLGEDRVEAAYLTREHSVLLTEMAEGLRALTGDGSRRIARPARERP
jgi:hypothetical protein